MRTNHIHHQFFRDSVSNGLCDLLPVIFENHDKGTKFYQNNYRPCGARVLCADDSGFASGIDHNIHIVFCERRIFSIFDRKK
jgi:hypothetical protein